jgi:hypothetical protein
VGTRSLGLDLLVEVIQARVGHLHDTNIGVNRAERIILRRCHSTGKRIEERRLAHVGQANDSETKIRHVLQNSGLLNFSSCLLNGADNCGIDLEHLLSGLQLEPFAIGVGKTLFPRRVANARNAVHTTGVTAIRGERPGSELGPLACAARDLARGGNSYGVIRREQ